MKLISEVAAWFTTHLETIVQATFSLPTIETDVKKIIVKPVLVKKSAHLMLQVAEFDKTKCITKNIDSGSVQEKLLELLTGYGSLFVRCTDAAYHITMKAPNCQVKKKLLQNSLTPDFSHNRKKQYAIGEEGRAYYPALIELGVLTQEGRVRPQASDKFRQINHFLEIVVDHLPSTESMKELTIIDFGCGKAYLTFALYEHLTQTLKRNVRMVGVDSKADVIANLQSLAKKLCYDGLSFVAGTIQEYTIEGNPDAVIALHACDIATDQAIAKAVHARAKTIFVAPCCQHELYSQLKPSASPILLKHGLYRERFAALLTDALRTELLKSVGYKTDVIEFVDPTHTPKNILIRAVKNGGDSTHLVLSEEYKALVADFGVTPFLENALRQSAND
ncbi:MAG: SAM-dependent methyltransferase [Chlamydiia bacterium]|nr:SAM-dependent methyltransferase [Chlamydiia bacterium]